MQPNEALSYISIDDNWKDGTNGNVQLSTEGGNFVQFKITGLQNRGVNWSIEIRAVNISED